MRIKLPSGTEAELATVDNPERALVLIPDVMGLRPLFDDHVAQLATQQNWNVCSFELYPGREHLPVQERLAAAPTLVDHEILADAEASAVATGCDTVVITGFCMGGMYALKAAATGHFRRSVAFYGPIRVPETWRGPAQGEPLELLTASSPCPTLAILGSKDPYTPPDDIAALEATGVDTVVYDGADHGFVHDPFRPAHRAEDAADAWAQALNFLNG